MVMNIAKRIYDLFCCRTRRTELHKDDAPGGLVSGDSRVQLKTLMAEYDAHENALLRGATRTPAAAYWVSDETRKMWHEYALRYYGELLEKEFGMLMN